MATPRGSWHVVAVPVSVTLAIAAAAIAAPVIDELRPVGVVYDAPFGLSGRVPVEARARDRR